MNTAKLNTGTALRLLIISIILLLASSAFTQIVIEDFNTGTWPWSPWTVVASGGSLSSSYAWEGARGIMNPGWHYRTTPSVGTTGQKLSVWVRQQSGSSGRAYFGFAASSSGCYSVLFAPNTSTFLIQHNSGYGYSDLVSTAYTYTANKWYKLEVEFTSSTAITARLIDSNGTTVLRTLTYSGITGAPGGIAIRSFNNVHMDYITYTNPCGPTAVAGRVDGATGALTRYVEDNMALTHYSISGTCSGGSWEYRWWHSVHGYINSWTTSTATVNHRPTHTGYYRYYARCSACTGTTLYWTSGTVTIRDYLNGPTSISAASTNICLGSTVRVTAGGGNGGKYYWTYKLNGSGCGTRVCDAALPGGGYNGYETYYDFTPTTAGTYDVFVERRGSPNGVAMGTTAYKCIRVYVRTPPTAPTSVSGGGTSCYTGSSTTLTASGGTSGSGATFTWRTGSCTGTIISSGSSSSSISVNPTTTTSYYVQRVGNSPCNGTVTGCASTTITRYNSGTAHGTWVGNVSSDWNDCKNWGGGRVPDNTLDVTIPSGRTYYPVLDGTLYINSTSGTYKCKSLTINSGGTVTVNGNYQVYIYGNFIVDGGTFIQKATSSNYFRVYSGGIFQVNGGNAYVGDGTGSYNDMYIASGGIVDIRGGNTYIDDKLDILSGGTYTQSGGNTYVCYRNGGSQDQKLDANSGGNFTMTGGSVYLCGAYSTSSSYCALYFDASSNVSVSGSSYIRFVNSPVSNRDYYVNFGGKTVRYIYNEKSSGYVYTTGGSVDCYQLRGYQGRFYLRTALTASSHVYVYDPARLYLDNSSSALTFGSSSNLYNYSYVYMNNGTLNGYRFLNYDGRLDMLGGTMTLSSYIYNLNSYSSNYIYMTGGIINTNSIPNYEGVIEHTGGTINNTGYYRENDSGGGNYYGSGSAVMNLNGSSDVRLLRSGSYFNDVNVNGTYSFNSASTQNWDINGDFTIGSSGSFNSTYRDIYLAGNWTNNGSFTHGSRTVYFNGSSAQTISGSSTTTFYNAHVTNSSGLNLNASTNARWANDITFGSNGFLNAPSTSGTPYWEDSTP